MSGVINDEQTYWRQEALFSQGLNKRSKALQAHSCFLHKIESKSCANCPLVYNIIHILNITH